jgi:voltage-gated potassium channel Kch
VIVICGFGPFGEQVARFLTTTTARDKASSRPKKSRELKYVAFDLDPQIVVSGFKSGKNVLYGDGSQPKVLATAGIEAPKAFVVTYSDSESTVKSVERLRLEYPTVPILCR